MSVDKQLLKNHLSNFKLNRNNAAEYHIQLFTLHPEMAEFYGADGIDPDCLNKSQKFIMQGMEEFQCFFRLVETYGDDKTWRSACSYFKEIYSDKDIPLEKFSIVGDAICAAISKVAGEATPEQKESWKNLIKKASDDMKSFGWY
ncbi:Globin-like domain and Globin, structural domain-containing protein [Strongyloides ratti]|uniref:Globin-like domain and Globin, structural domain-containing protein n=1 Tax=Strongyloides ratti TaxID=34506 RepID=A0A090KPU9_STRRB|nr:Globin-like domain and Globin, structural domain-containing protein [Strongyloides ratti]CEF59409.1 Globin-like domain and Globin, structural domain-containing protein [Strongyloides ratti]